RDYVSFSYVFNKNLLFFIRSAIALFASWFLHSSFCRFACFLQQSSHAILVPQPENRQSRQFCRAVPNASVETLTRYSKPSGEFHLGQAELLADPVKLSPVHFSILCQLRSDVQLRYILRRREHLGVIYIRLNKGALNLQLFLRSRCRLPA